MFLKISELGGKIERPTCKSRLPAGRPISVRDRLLERTGAVLTRGSCLERARRRPPRAARASLLLPPRRRFPVNAFAGCRAEFPP